MRYVHFAKPKIHLEHRLSEIFLTESKGMKKSAIGTEDGTWKNKLALVGGSDIV